MVTREKHKYRRMETEKSSYIPTRNLLIFIIHVNLFDYPNSVYHDWFE